jgi:hypothetical protein
LLVLEMVLLFDVAPQPWGAIAFFSIQAAQLTTYAVIVWRRTRLAISTLGGAAAAAASVLLLGLYAAGYTWHTFPVPWAVPVYALLALVPLSVIAEARVHRAERAQWRRHMEGMKLRDVLLCRHIPRLHTPGAKPLGDQD